MAELSDGLDGLSTSSQAAVRFAHASAGVRSRGEPPEIDGLDLMLGVLLAHPGSSSAQRCLEHFRFTVGDIKPNDRLTASVDELNDELRRIDPNWGPLLDFEGQRALQGARERPGGDGTVHLRHLWGGLLRLETGPLAEMIGAVLRRRGTTLSELSRATDRWLDDEKNTDERYYSDFLATELPYQPQPVAVATYHHESGTRSGDLLQLSGEVDAFAYLLASKDLKPPLAIGLFGDWGSGKTFFMGSVQDRVRRVLADPAVAEVPQRDSTFWKRIVQIDFNAWHYSEGDLLASLVDHLFTELERQTAGRPANVAVDEHENWLRELTAVTEQEEEAHRRVEDQSSAVGQAEADVVSADAATQARLATIDQTLVTSSIDQVKAAITPIWGALPLGAAVTVADAQQEIDRAKHEVTRSRALAQSFWNTGWQQALSIVIVALIPVLVLVVNAAQSWAESAVAGIAAAGGEVVVALMAANRWMATRNDQLEQARATVQEELREKTAEVRRAADTKRDELQAARGKLAEAEQALAALVAERTTIEQRINEPEYQAIQRFIQERLKAGTYRDRLGLHAIVHRDLARLAEFIGKQNEQEYRRGPAAPADQPAPEPTRMFNRIILYIDDLDRCPDEKVVEVLRAVHLLLAFNLFVVVVAVDDRWLSHALETQYPVLAQRTPASTGPAMAPVVGVVNADDDAPSPSDYLEKIFQIPFRVRPIGSDGRRRMIDGLLRGQVFDDTTRGGWTGGQTSARLISSEEEAVLASTVRSWSRDVSAAGEDLTLTPDEFKMLNALAPLLGDTPRSVKRFVNLYQLLKMMDSSTTTADPPDYQVAALLLGLDEGSPEVASLVRNLGSDTLGSIGELRELCADQPHWAGVTADRIEAIEELVARFQFPHRTAATTR